MVGRPVAPPAGPNRRGATGHAVEYRVKLRKFVPAGLVLVLGTVTSQSGCVSSTVRRGMQAERAGADHVAYDHFRAAAARDPDSRTAAAGIRRTSEGAARHWEDRAHKALEAGDHAAAWKHLMHVLAIRPDHPSAADLVRKLEEEHPGELGRARDAWLARGERALVVAEPAERPGPGPAEPAVTGAPGEAVAEAAPETPAPPRTERVAERPGRQVARPPAEPPRERRRVEVRPPRRQPPRPERRAGERRFPPTEHRPGPRPTAEHGRRRELLVTGIVSHEDRRYPRMTETLDGLFVRVRDTDDDPDADLEVFLGRQRIAKKKNMRVGDGLTVVGHSGRRYVVVVLSIYDETETVRFGIRPARR